MWTCIITRAYTCIDVLYVRAIVCTYMRVCDCSGVCMCLRVRVPVAISGQIQHTWALQLLTFFIYIVGSYQYALRRVIGSAVHDTAFSSVSIFSRQSGIQHGCYCCATLTPESCSKEEMSCVVCEGHQLLHACVCVSFYVCVYLCMRVSVVNSVQIQQRSHLQLLSLSVCIVSS